MGTKKKRYKKPKETTPELNVMPFIDIFSMLNTFLLVSASFIGLGILEVQVPFFSNSPDLKDDKPTRSLSIRVDVEESNILLTTSWSEPPEDEKKKDYKLDEEGLEQFHQDLIQLKTDVPESDKVTMFTDDNVKYDQMILVLDAIKTLKETDPSLPQPEDSGSGQDSRNPSRFLYNKVVMGSVIL
ncbi:biopolymer transporter ExbD [Pseudobacteriovorax antillogorgiicola]|uniref:Biopolymer transport protein ExbD n=1 Tax=Pseudobacteriovorax antillogorgiicola TaxID=1513793 RepID=A0A1Y6CNF6_9BACT|nr:biopolymer transporter ExbD [Pseudobacteriovorax antillogorgiicola]TCS47276.1 biopolymer transport protein ExbD [Pseudobacteriovorax antillogorgiicola]SMF62253.1 Biopolymer transport protein ExbD [Pseudobacteriovorax antillogorgiicola]